MNRRCTDLSSWRAQFAPEIVGEHPTLLDAIEKVRRVANSDCTVLISGESGTGKELIARSIHDASSRSSGPLVAVNCAAIPDTMMESELFGHVRGAFTGASSARAGRFAAADGGTLFLDEIGEMPAAAQAKLLRVIQEGVICPVGSDDEVRVDVRIVAATNRDLAALSASGGFRADLYFRLNVIPVHLPALRERAEDIDALAHTLLDRASRRHRREGAEIEPAALRLLRTLPWPGNVRELGHSIERAVLLAGDGPIDAAALGLTPVKPHLAPCPPPSDDEDLDLRNALRLVERSLIDKALNRTGGNRTEAAALLGLNRTTLVEKLRKYAS